MSSFTLPELEYLQGGSRLGRIATVGPDGTPHVAPVGYAYNAELDTIDVGGRDFAATKKYRDVQHQGRCAIVIDDVASVDPWRPRGIEVRGGAEAIASPDSLVRIHPERIVSWGIEGDGTGPRQARSIPR